MPDALVLFGRRRKALEAADALGVPVILVSDRPVSGYPCLVANLLPHETGNRDSLAELAARIRALAKPLAVVALTEKGVVPSAEIRATLGLPGLTPTQATACTDKLIMKRTIRAVGLRCTDFCSADDGLRREDLIERLGMPMIIKQRVGSGGRGTRLVTSENEVPDRLQQSDLAERLVSGREMSIESFVVDGELLFTSITDYFEPGWANIVPGELTEGQHSQLDSMNRAALDALSLSQGVAHLEFFVQDKRIVFGEMAARPPGGHLLELIGLAWGFDAWQALIRIALGEIPAFPRQPSEYAGVRILHPGPGVVDGIDGIPELSVLPAVRHITLHAHPGRRYSARKGVGEEAGHVIATGSALEPVQKALRKAAQDLRFRMRRA